LAGEADDRAQLPLLLLVVRADQRRQPAAAEAEKVQQPAFLLLLPPVRLDLFLFRVLDQRQLAVHGAVLGQARLRREDAHADVVEVGLDLLAQVQPPVVVLLLVPACRRYRWPRRERRRRGKREVVVGDR